MHMHGKFFWYDIMTIDMKASAKFDADVVGWGTRVPVYRASSILC